MKNIKEINNNLLIEKYGANYDVEQMKLEIVSDKILRKYNVKANYYQERLIW